MSATELAAHLEGRIARGELRPGREMPSIAELARWVGTSPSLANRAIDLLKNAGRVHGRGPGRRAVVADEPSDL